MKNDLSTGQHCRKRECSAISLPSDVTQVTQSLTFTHIHSKSRQLEQSSLSRAALACLAPKSIGFLAYSIPFCLHPVALTSHVGQPAALHRPDPAQRKGHCWLEAHSSMERPLNHSLELWPCCPQPKHHNPPSEGCLGSKTCEKSCSFMNSLAALFCTFAEESKSPASCLSVSKLYQEKKQ